MMNTIKLAMCALALAACAEAGRAPIGGSRGGGVHDAGPVLPAGPDLGHPSSTADMAGGNTPDMAGGNTPDMAGGNTPDMAGGDTPDMAGGDTPDMAGGDTPDMAGGGGTVDPGCAAAIASQNFTFEMGAQSFTHYAVDGFNGYTDWPYDEWQLGTPSGPGPGSCHGGSKCWGTYIAGDYVNCERAELFTPVIDLSACPSTAVKFTFWHYFDFWSGDYNSFTYSDGGRVEFTRDGGNTWAENTPGLNYPGEIDILGDRGGYYCYDSANFYVDLLDGFVGQSGGWKKVEITVPSDFRVTKFAARFIYGTGVSYPSTNLSTSRANSAPGWYIDDVSIQMP
jgi:hypothetical protein